MEELTKYLKALVLLQIAALEAGDMSAKVEPLLARAGLSHREIAELLGKSYMAVAKAVSRAGKRKGGT